MKLDLVFKVEFKNPILYRVVYLKYNTKLASLNFPQLLFETLSNILKGMLIIDQKTAILGDKDIGANLDFESHSNAE